MTLISAMRNATNALLGDQMALNATADNISNQNTAGYARRQATWSTRDSVTIGSNTGISSPVVTVAAQRDGVLDRAVQSAQSASTSANTAKAALSSLESIFAIDGSGNESSGISSALSGFFSAASSVAASPNSTSARNTLYASAQSVAQAFQSTSALLKQQSSALDSSIQDDVSSVNAATEAIAALNGQIRSLPAGAERDSLLDTRNSQVDALSKLVGLSQTTDSDGSLNLSTSNGAPLVLGTQNQALTTTVVSGKLQVRSGGNDVTSGLTGGSIGGTIAVRNGALQQTADSLDGLAASFATAVNTVNSAGYLQNGTAGSALFSVPATTADAAAQLKLLASDGDAFAAARSSEGSGGNSNATAMAALQSAKGSNGETFAQVMSDAVNLIGTAAANGNTAAATTSTLLTSATAQQGNVSGISLDTEAANLTQYQRSYQVEAKLISILNEVMATSINLGSNTTVS